MQSACAKRVVANKVSAGYGPSTCIPCCCACLIAGAIIRCSSSPKYPPSPACGFNPHTLMRGGADKLKQRRNSLLSIVNTANNDSSLNASATARNGKCVVAKATRIAGAANSITVRCTPAHCAKYSVCPTKGMPAAKIVSLLIGAVTNAENSCR